MGALPETTEPSLGYPEPGSGAGWLGQRARATGPRVREVSRATEEHRGGIAPGAPRESGEQFQPRETPESWERRKV